MQIASSARRTCIASASAVEWTATVLMPISWQARWMRSAISPRLAMRTFSMAIIGCRSFDDRQRLLIFDGLAILDKDLLHDAGFGAGNRVHHLHRLDDHQGVALVDALADGDEGRRAGLRRQIGGAYHRRFHRARMVGGIGLRRRWRWCRRGSRGGRGRG